MFSADLGVTPSSANYIEDVFSTYLYTGSRPTGQSIQNGIDLSAKGGLVWLKDRSAANSHGLFDSARGIANGLYSNQTSAQFSYPSGVTSFNSNGFTLGADSGGFINISGNNYASWTFREQAKFFDIVTYTGNGANRTIAHNLGSVPGCIIVKRTDTTSNWSVYHRSLTSAANIIELNSTAAQSSAPTWWNSTAPTATVFSLGTSTSVNASGGTYVAYLFAHDAGGFGATGTDNVISCGSFTGVQTVTLGWEPQWLLIKSTSTTGSWYLYDTMRGWTASGTDNLLSPNTADAESSFSGNIYPTATGFVTQGAGSPTYIYIAIRRGPMKTPTTGTSVLSVKLYAATTTSATVTHDVTFDAEINANRTVAIEKFLFVDSLRGINGQALVSANSNIEASFPTYWSRQSQRTMYAPSAFDGWWASASGTNNHVSYGLVRAPGFFDVVCFTQTTTSAAQSVSHNLTVTPELVIVKPRSSASGGWEVFPVASNNRLPLNATTAASTYAPLSAVSASAFSYPMADLGVSIGTTFVAYLFATVAGVSKVGSYTGTGTTNQINCGFTGGARFVMIRRTDSTGDWYVWDSARGIVAGNDPYLLLNSTAAEVTSTDYVDTYSAGFEISSTAPAAINANGGTFIFWAIA